MACSPILPVLAACLIAGAAAPCRAASEGLHDGWDALVRTHVDADGLVDYAGFRRDGAALDAYLDRLAATDPAGFDRAGRLAYWINAYNAFTVKLILEHYPVTSIRDIKPDPWKQTRWTAAGRTLSLDGIEHDILRKNFKEPRIHFAVNCASIGCPPLLNRAYTAANLESRLDAQARRVIRSDAHVRTGTRRRGFRTQPVLYVNRIFEWFAEDFTAGGKRPIQDYIRRYADDATRQFIRDAGAKLVIDYLDYDWSLNALRPPPSAP